MSTRQRGPDQRFSARSIEADARAIQKMVDALPDAERVAVERSLGNNIDVAADVIAAGRKLWESFPPDFRTVVREFAAEMGHDYVDSGRSLESYLLDVEQGSQSEEFRGLIGSAHVFLNGMKRLVGDRFGTICMPFLAVWAWHKREPARKRHIAQYRRLLRIRDEQPTSLRLAPSLEELKAALEKHLDELRSAAGVEIGRKRVGPGQPSKNNERSIRRLRAENWTPGAIARYLGTSVADVKRKCGSGPEFAGASQPPTFPPEQNSVDSERLSRETSGE
jgi:hypothetical protein